MADHHVLYTQYLKRIFTEMAHGYTPDELADAIMVGEWIEMAGA